jgi:hypothetical protein
MKHTEKPCKSGNTDHFLDVIKKVKQKQVADKVEHKWVSVRTTSFLNS